MPHKSSIWQRINRHISKFSCVMIEQVDGKVYLLKEHWRYLNWQRSAERVLLGKGRISTNRFEYLTHEFPIYKRTKFHNMPINKTIKHT